MCYTSCVMGEQPALACPSWWSMSHEDPHLPCDLHPLSWQLCPIGDVTGTSRWTNRTAALLEGVGVGGSSFGHVYKLLSRCSESCCPQSSLSSRLLYCARLRSRDWRRKSGRRHVPPVILRWTAGCASSCSAWDAITRINLVQSDKRIV